MIFELCAETAQACRAARDGGAHRIELCRDLTVGGLTPEDTLIATAVATGLPVHAMLRPRAGDFVYSDAEFNEILATLARVKQLGIAGVVTGILTPDGLVDIARMQQIVHQATPLEVTFHRAFDEAANLEAGLDAAIATGCHRLLTSGGAPDVLIGASRLRKLNEQAAGRITIAAGGGLRLENAAEVARVSGLRDFHGTLRREDSLTDPEDIRRLLAILGAAAS